MIKKSNRLTRSQFTNFFKTGRRFNSPTLTVVYTPYDSFHGSVVVGKKVAKLAVRRNRLRRRLYDQLRQYHARTGALGVFIIIAKPPFNTLTTAAAQLEIKQLLEKTTKAA